MANYNGRLNANEIYTALYNMIISQQIFDISTAEPSLANALRVDGSMYGDTKLYTSMDTGASYDWENDAEAANLLSLNRNKTQQTQKVSIDKFRQTNVTVDNYLTKRAWMTEGSFVDFNGVMISNLSGVKRIYDNGYINSFVGTQISGASAANITVNRPAAGNNDTTEMVNRLTAQSVAKAFADLAVDLGDNNRYYNELTFNRSVPASELAVVWNANVYNSILKIDLPTIFHKDGLEPKASYILPGRYFGTVNATTATGNTNTATTADGRTVPGKGVNGAVRSLIEQTIGTGEDAIHYFPGDAIATGVTASAGTSYTEDSADIACKVFPLEAIPFMSGFETGTMFNNPRSLTDTHYLTWGHNTLVRLLEKPFVTITLATPTVVGD